MKKTIFFWLFLILNSNILFAQYTSIFGAFQTSWNIGVYTPYGYLTDSLNIVGDTILNGLNYKVVESNAIDSNGMIVLANGIYGFIREDSISGKAWFRKVFNTTEYLFYDISLTVNDSFYSPGINSGYYQLDSVYFLGNTKHGVVDFHYGTTGIHFFNNKLTFIEGISTNYGFHYDQNDPIRLDPVLLCVYKDGQMVFQQNYNDPFYTNCNLFLPVGIQEIKSASYVLVYPNPANNILFIKNDNNAGLKGKLVNFFGIEVMSFYIAPDALYSVDISGLSAGIYYCEFTNKYCFGNKIILIE